MNCPNDGTTLQMSERSGVEIDYCPQCRGVWLDRGELDKIIERANAQLAAAEASRYDDDDRERRERKDERRDERRDRSDWDQRSSEKQKPKKKKSSFLSDIFESFGE